jgi:pimeloyl-ACP methyl ester carboxylesterase
MDALEARRASLRQHLWPMSADEQTPETRYATFGDDRIAYQVFGDGDLDLIFAPVIGDGIDLRWDWPSYVSFLRRLATQARVIMFDLRGTGASDAPSGETLPIWDRWADEAQAVLDAVASERAVLLGHADGGQPPSSLLPPIRIEPGA